MMPKFVALPLGLGVALLSGCANQSANQMHGDKHPHTATIMQGADLKRRCAKMMERHGQKGANDMMRKREGTDDMKMKGCKMMKGEGLPDPARTDRKAPENSVDHSAHNSQP